MKSKGKIKEKMSTSTVLAPTHNQNTQKRAFLTLPVLVVSIKTLLHESERIFLFLREYPLLSCFPQLLFFLCSVHFVSTMESSCIIMPLGHNIAQLCAIVPVLETAVLTGFFHEIVPQTLVDLWVYQVLWGP